LRFWEEHFLSWREIPSDAIDNKFGVPNDSRAKVMVEKIKRLDRHIKEQSDLIKCCKGQNKLLLKQQEGLISEVNKT
jgi:hypothetical protein